MTPWRDNLTLGFSMDKQEFKVGEPISLRVWADNSGDTETNVASCSDLLRFKAWHIVVYDASGNRILSRYEAEEKAKCGTPPKFPLYVGVMVCARNAPILIPAHSCITRDHPDFMWELTDNYKLTPGTYTVRVRTDARGEWDICIPEQKQPVVPAEGTAVTFTVVKP